MKRTSNTRIHNVHSNRQAYVDGSAVRKLNTLPKPKEYGVPKQNKRQSRRVYKNREKAMLMDAQYTIFLVLAVMATFLVSGQYVYFRNEIVKKTKNLSVYEAELLEIHHDNDAMRDSLKTMTGLSYVYQKATEELGMAYPSEEQVILYNKEEVEYVK